MNKNELREILTKLSPTEKLCKVNSDVLSGYDFPYFDYVLDSQNRQIYTYTFERHLQKALTRTPHVARYLEKLPLLIFKHARFSYTPFHVHDFVELTFVYRGTINMIINNHEVTLKQGDVCILDTDVSHKILDTNEKDILINFLMNKKYFSNKMLSRLGSNNIISHFAVESISEAQDHNQYIIFNTNNSELLMDAVEGLLSNYFDSSYYSVDTIDAYMVIIFSELIKAHQKEKSIEYQKSNHMYIIDILQYIENNYNTCSLESLANKFGYNSSYLSRYIKKSTGKTFIEIIQELRLNQACIMLKNSTVSIEYIIQTVGYKNVAFFYKKFTELFGMSPKEFREKQNI
jgi:YesN/AraC family two-component response regulator